MKDLKTKLKIAIKGIFKKFGVQVSRLPYEGKNREEMIKIRVGKFDIMVNGNHMLPMYMRNPSYSTNLPRLAAKVKEKYSDLIMIDVGANVGDTVAFARSKSYFPIVCIEGDDEFFGILENNLKQFKDVYPFKMVLGEKDGVIGGVLEKNEGSTETARIRNSNSAGAGSLDIVTLDSFFKANGRFEKAKLLKTDTDGYDLKIVRGGMDYIKKTKPVLFFEYDTVFLGEQDDDGLSTLATLEAQGYRDAIFYDNQGNFLLSAKLSDHLLLKQLHNMINKNYRTPFPFYDIVLFHEEDSDIAKGFIEDEMKLFYGA